ncbi:hypothetical protein JL722_4268 [Aureococcus anophagefferens]|nr:hypothetical protein JL722_4268 [Aureococcus anophagefferens]
MVRQQPRCAGAAALVALVAALPPAGAVELQLGALLPFTDQAGGVYEDGMQRSVAVAYLEAARDFNARDGSLPGELPPSAVYDAAGAPYDAYLSGRSLTTVAVAATYTGLASRLLVSSSATAAAFTNSGSFPYFARTCPVDYNAAIAVADLLHAYGYTTFGIVVDDTDPATGNVATNVASSAELRAYGISASVSVPIYDFSDADETEAMLEVLVDQGVKIIVAVVFAQNFPALVDAAEAVGLFNPKTLWIFVEFHARARRTQSSTRLQRAGAVSDATLVAYASSTKGALRVHATPDMPQVGTWDAWVDRWATLDPADYEPALSAAGAAARLGAGYFDDAANRSLETGYAYDAVAAIGIADVDFVGVSGRVALKGTDRRPRYAPYAVTNVRANGTVDYVATVQNHSWFYNDMALPQYPFRQAVYYDGTSTIVNDTEPDCAKIGYFNRTTYTCEQCAPGSEPDGTNLYCEPCAPGYARAGGDGACGACAGDFSYQPDAGAAACLSCPVATVKLTTNAGLSADECVCMKGYYSSESTWNSTQWKRSGLPGVPCYSCPEGATCDGGDAMPVNKKDFWGTPRQPFRFYAAFYECEYGHCRSDFRCDAGYRGAHVLGAHPRGVLHALRAAADDLPGVRGRARRGALVVFGYAVLVGVWLHVNSAYLARYRVLLVYIYFLQIMAVVMRFNYENLPNHAPPVQIVRMLLDLSLFDFAVFMPTCVLELTELGAFGLQFLFIFFGFAFLFLPVLREMFTKFVEEWSYRNWEAIKKSLDFYEGDFGEKIYRRIGVFLTLVDVQRPLMTYVALQMLRCDRYYDEKTYFRADPMLKCEADRRAVLGLAAGFIFAVFSVGLPLASYVCIHYEYKVHRGVHMPHIQALYGWSFGDFRLPYHAARFHKQYLVWAVCLISALFDEILVELVAITACMYPATVIHCVTQPYSSSILNRVETLGLSVTIAAVLLGFLASLGDHTTRFSGSFIYGTFLIHAIFFAVVMLCAYKESEELKIEAATAASLHEKICELFAKDDAANEKRKLEIARRRHEVQPPKTGCCGAAAKALGRVARGRASLVEVLAGDDLDDLPYRTQQGIEAMQEVLRTFNTTVFQMTIDSVERTNEDLEKFRGPVSHFWRNLSSQNKGIIDFVAKLKEAERIVFFGVLVRLQRYLADPAPSNSAMHDLVQDEDRSSVLDYLLGAKEARFEDCVALLRDLVGACASHHHTWFDELVFLPKSVHHVDRSKVLAKRRASISLDDVAGDEKKLIAKFRASENRACAEAQHICAARDEPPAPATPEKKKKKEPAPREATRPRGARAGAGAGGQGGGQGGGGAADAGAPELPSAALEAAKAQESALDDGDAVEDAGDAPSSALCGAMFAGGDDAPPPRLPGKKTPKRPRGRSRGRAR